MKITRWIAALLVLISLFSVSVSAAEPYRGYNYDAWGDSIPAPNGYTVQQILTFADTALLGLKQPQDLVLEGEYLYILDSGNSRIVVCDTQLQPIQAITVTDSAAQAVDISGAKGLFVKDGRLVIADTVNARVLITDADGVIVRVVGGPAEGTLPTESPYAPCKVILDDLENLYVISENCYLGALVFNAAGEFDGFFGANKVSLTAAQLVQRLWRKLMTEKQASYTANYVPIDYKNFDIDGQGFIYTCSANANLDQLSRNEIKKLNALGDNILLTDTTSRGVMKSDYGDKERVTIEKIYYDTSFIDVDVCRNGFINALDATRGRVFQYNQDSDLLTVFGGIDEQKGTFVKPIAIESVGDSVLVLDEAKNSITVFTPTQYGAVVRKAVMQQSAGRFDECLESWREVLRYNSNSELANSSIGRVLMQKEQYKEALHYFKLGQDRTGYSSAFRFYRSELLKIFFPVLAIALIALVTYALMHTKIKQRIYEKRGYGPREKSLYISHTLTHPLNFFEDLFYNKSKSALVGSFAVAALLVLATALESQATGFIFNQNKPSEFNIFLVLAFSLGLILLLTVSNWIVSTLLWGEGTFKQAWMGTCYALVPYIIALYVSVILSNILVLEEGALTDMVLTAGLLYSVFLLFTSVRLMQQYTFKRAVAATVLIVLVSLLLLFLLVLVYSLLRQIFVFALTLVTEILFRV